VTENPHGRRGKEERKGREAWRTYVGGGGPIEPGKGGVTGGRGDEKMVRNPIARGFVENGKRGGSRSRHGSRGGGGKKISQRVQGGGSPDNATA